MVGSASNVRPTSHVRPLRTVRGSRNVRPKRVNAAANAANAQTLAFPRLTTGDWHARRPKLLALAATILLGALVLAFFNFDLFYIFEPDVVGLQNLPKEEVIRASGVTGYNVFFVDAGSVERALSRLPEIKSVKVIPGLPNLLSIQITEREPAVVWQRGADKYWVDSDGIAFRPHGTIPDLATIRDLDQAAVKPGQKINTKALVAYGAVRTALPDAPRLFEWSAARGLAFTDERGWKIYLGDENGMTGKVVKFRALVQQLVEQKEQVKFIDLGKGDPYYQ